MSGKGIHWFTLLIAVLLVAALGLGWMGLRPTAPASAIPTVSLGAQVLCVVTPSQQARSLVVDDILNARKSVLVECYLISDPAIVQALQSARLRGCDVRVIMEETPFGGFSMNKTVRNQLRSSGIDANWGNRIYSFTHAKYVVIDDSVAWIMTANLSKSAFDKNREILVRTCSQTAVADLVRIFWADRRRNPCAAGSLVVSPVNARQRLLGLLRESCCSVEIASEVLDDQETCRLLRDLAGRGVRVRVLVAAPESIAVNAVTRSELEGTGVAVRYLETPYLHAKYIVVDTHVAYVGSHNLSAGSLDENREVGVITDDSMVVSTLEATFSGDWDSGR
ncbi:MAG: phospholipase D-like domain-containing protein [Caldiserica bacterium]|nr:phospholipase D-like domain-containing protein [Caldisericota bacterium]